MDRGPEVGDETVDGAMVMKRGARTEVGSCLTCEVWVMHAVLTSWRRCKIRYMTASIHSYTIFRIIPAILGPGSTNTVII